MYFIYLVFLYLQLWCNSYLNNIQFHEFVNTNNGLERIHKDLKKFYLSLKGQKSLTTCVKTILYDYLPDKFKTYISSQNKIYIQL